MVGFIIRVYYDSRPSERQVIAQMGSLPLSPLTRTLRSLVEKMSWCVHRFLISRERRGPFYAVHDVCSVHL